MIGKPLSDRYDVGPLAPERAAAVVRNALGSHGKAIIEVRMQDPGMVACLFVDADRATVRLCRTLGFELKPGGTGVFGLQGADVARLFTGLSASQREAASIPCGARETKVLLLAGGLALLSIEAEGGRVDVRSIA